MTPTHTYYHGTVPENVDSIMREGLDPAKSSSYYWDPETKQDVNEPYVFLADHEDLARDFSPGGKHYDDTNPDNSRVFQVDLPEDLHNKLVTDQGEFIRAPFKIDPKHLKLLDKVKPKDTK